MRRLRIALVHPYSWPEVRRGGERYLSDLAWYLRGRGHEVDVITGGDASSSEHLPGGRVRRLRHRGAGGLARYGITTADTFGVRALGVLVRRRYDVVHALTPTAALAARAARQPTVYTVLGHPTPALLAETPPATRRLMSQAVRRATATTALTVSAAAGVAATFGRDPHVLPPGIRLDEFPPGLEPRLGPPRILFPAFAGDPNKGLVILLRAFARIRDEFDDARLLLGGPGDPAPALAELGPDRDRVAAAIDDLGVGALDDVPARYRAATVTTVPSRFEAFGLVLVESLACGTPAVCSSTDSGMPEIVDRPEVGRAVPFGDPAALAAALAETIRLARDPLTPRRCRTHAERWDWAASVGPRHEELYGSVARRAT